MKYLLEEYDELNEEIEDFYVGNYVWFFHKTETYYGKIVGKDTSNGYTLYALEVPGVKFEPGDSEGRIYARPDQLRFDK